MYDIQTLDQEFTNMLTSFADHHEYMRSMTRYYRYSAYYDRKKGDPKPPSDRPPINLLKAFADKNINYTSKFPTIKVPHAGPDIDTRQRCGEIEKIYYATAENNNLEHKQKRWAGDTTLRSEAFAVTEFDLKTREVKIKRYDPRYCYYRFADDGSETLAAFWVAYPMQKEAIKAQFGIDDPGTSGIDASAASMDGNETPVDGFDRYWVIFRWDNKVKCAWVGSQFIQQPFKHDYGFIPVDRCAPIDSQDLDRKGGFFLEPLIGPQAEFNETFRRRCNIVRKLGNPTLYGKGIVANQWDEVKSALAGDGGFIGLKQNGELGTIEIKETTLFDTHLDRTFQHMKDIAGFPTATFGEIIGANTSGDALNMYFQPTTQAVERQWIDWKLFYTSIFEKVGRLYERFLRADESKDLYGHYPKGTFEYLPTEDGGMKSKYVSGGYGVSFNKFVFQGYYRSIIITPSATPRDEMAYKRLVMEAANTGFLPKVEAYDEWGIIDPEDTLDLLATEAEDPRLHPDTFNKVSKGLNNAMPQQPGLGAPQPDMSMLGAGNVQPG